MAARLRPWSVGQVLAGGRDRPTRGWEDARDVFGPLLDSFLKSVELCDWKSLVKPFDQVLMAEVGRWKPSVMVIDTAEQFIGGGYRLTPTVARERNITRRQVERQVRTLTQTSPKRLACLSRFQRVRDAIWADPSMDLAALAIDAGYSDQPHMTRHFKRYSGQTPGQFVRSSIAKKKWLESSDVAFVQELRDDDV